MLSIPHPALQGVFLSVRRCQTRTMRLSYNGYYGGFPSLGSGSDSRQALNAAIAQLAEQLIRNQQVEGSNPSCGLNSLPTVSPVFRMKVAGRRTDPTGDSGVVNREMEVCPRGRRSQTRNLVWGASPSRVRIPRLPNAAAAFRVAADKWFIGEVVIMSDCRSEVRSSILLWTGSGRFRSGQTERTVNPRPRLRWFESNPPHREERLFCFSFT